MATEPKNPEQLPGGDDLDAELDRWQNEFDAMTSNTGGPAGVKQATSPGSEAVDVDTDARENDALPDDVDALFDGMSDEVELEFGEALGGMLGGSEPAPLPELREDDVLSSAKAPSSPRASLRGLPALVDRPSASLPSAPTDDEIFGEAAQKDFGAALLGDDLDERRSRDTEPPASPPDAEDADEDAGGGFHEATRIAQIDPALLAKAASPGPIEPARKPATPLPGSSDITRKSPFNFAPSSSSVLGPTGGKKLEPRRGPAVVRRGEPRSTPNDFGEVQSTRIADADAMAALAGEEDNPSSDDLRFDDGPIGAGVGGGSAGAGDDDDSFYDDIEIAAAPAVPTPAAPQPSGPARRFTQNVVRRATPAAGVPRIAPTPEPARRPAGSTQPPPSGPPSGMGVGHGDEPESIELVSDEPELFLEEPVRDTIPPPLEAHAMVAMTAPVVSPLEDAMASAAVAADELAAARPISVNEFDDAPSTAAGASPDEGDGDGPTTLFRPEDKAPAFDAPERRATDDMADTGERQRQAEPSEDDDEEPLLLRAPAGPTAPPPSRPRPQTVPPPVRARASSVPPVRSRPITVQPSVVVAAEMVLPALPEYLRGEPRPLDLPALELDPARFRFPEVDAGGADAADAATRLAVIERELGLDLGKRPASAELRLAAGRAAIAAGELGRARELLDDTAGVGARALRRVAVGEGELGEAIGHLDAELRHASGAAERRALAAYRADLLVAAGEQDLARVAHGELSDADPGDLRPLFAQIELAFADDREAELPGLCQRAAERLADPRLAAAFRALGGRTLARLGQLEPALAALAVARQDPEADREGALASAGLALADGQFAAAGDALAVLLTGGAGPALTAAIERRRALARQAMEDPAGALASLEAARAAAPTDPLVLGTLAEAYQVAGRGEDAAATLAALAEAEAGDPPRRVAVLRQLALLDTSRGEVAGAAAAYRRLAEADPTDLDAAADLEAACVAAGELDAAVALCKASGDRHALWRAARHLERGGRLDEAAQLLGEVPEAARTLERLLRREGRYAELAALRGAQPEPDAAGLLSAARLADRAGDPASRWLAWAAATAKDGESLAAALGAWRAAEASGDPARIVAALAESGRLASDPALVVDLALRRVALAQARGIGAGEALEQATTADPHDPRVASAEALVDAGAGRWEEIARRQAERAAGRPPGPGADALRFAAAAIYEERSEALSAAAELAQPLVLRWPAFLGARVLVERVLRRLGDPSGLAAQRARLLGLDEPAPVSEPASLRFAGLLELAELYESRLGEPARAVAAYRAALALRPDDRLALIGFRRACESAGEVGPLAERVMSDLSRANDSGDRVARAAAYEELARIDGELRGDAGSALLAWESVLEMDPQRVPALRALERAYARESRDAELLEIYGKLEMLAATPADVAVLAQARGRLEDALGQHADAQASARRALTASPDARRALFQLEAAAHHTGVVTPELAQLADAVARAFTGDAHAQAAFLARAGDAYVELGNAEEAAARYRAATDVSPGHDPALRAWRRLALNTGRHGEVVESCEREAQVATSDAERARLYHLAACFAMDLAGDHETASENLRRVLVADPRHDDALVRLRRLLEEQGNYDDLVQVLSARLAVEPSPARVVDLHATLARLFRDFLGDGERAKQHLREVLAREPNHLASVAALSDLAWEQGAWQEAADALILRARLEKQPRVLKDVFFRLGTIYADKLPDTRWALKSFERVLQLDPGDDGALEQVSRLALAAGDHKLALGASERLLALSPLPASKIEHLLRVAHIQEDGLKDASRAELALKAALDVDPGDPRVLPAVSAFYLAQKDPTSLRVQMDRVAAHMRQRLRRDMLDGAAYRVLSRALVTRDRAGVAGSLAPAICAAELAVLLGAGEDAEKALCARLEAPRIKGLADLNVDEVLFPPGVPSGFRQIFRLLHETLAKRHPADLRRWGVGKADRLPKSGTPVRDVIASVAVELGVGEVDVYVSSAHPRALVIESTDPMTLVLGSQLAAGTQSELRFSAGRALKLAASHLAVPARLSAEELGALLAGVVRLYDPGFTAPGVAMGLAADEQQRLGRLISKRLRDEVLPFASEVAGGVFDPKVFAAGVDQAGHRAGLIAAGSVRAALDVVLRVRELGDLGAARGDASVEELLRFAVSDELAEIRRLLA